MSIVVTGAAGFIGYHVCGALLDRGESVVGIDNLNDYYDPALKQARLERLKARRGFSFHRLDIAEHETLLDAFARFENVTGIVHLAAQAGVRYSLENPFAYVTANVMGQVAMLEAARRLPGLSHLVYASSSSVYGANDKVPFAVADRADKPVSLYGATKRADEHMTRAYCHLYGLSATGLRFFTVYGPWGRPDMAAYLFAKAMIAGKPIKLFNRGEMRRDFTYIDDIAAGIVACLDHPPEPDGDGVAHKVFNLGNSRSERLLDYLGAIEKALGMKAKTELLPMQPGDVSDTFADIEASRRAFGFEPKVSIDEGVPRFIEWFRAYEGR